MKLSSMAILTLCILTTITSCKKTDSPGNVGIVGKWQLDEVYSGYANGGNFMWNTVSIDNSHILEFTQDGKSSKKENINGNNQECIGTYNLQTSTILEVNSNCNTVTEVMFISELTENSLVLDRRVTEGKIRYKYIAFK